MQSAAQQISIKKFGPPDVLALERAAVREAGADELKIKVKYSGINFADLQMRLGFYPDAPPKPFVPGYEVAGHVEQVGPGVEGFRVGDPVIAGTYFGGYASEVTLPARQVFRLPESLTLEQGAALPVAFFTAQLALFEMGRVRRGDRVLIVVARHFEPIVEDPELRVLVELAPRDLHVGPRERGRPVAHDARREHTGRRGPDLQGLPLRSGEALDGLHGARVREADAGSRSLARTHAPISGAPHLLGCPKLNIQWMP